MEMNTRTLARAGLVALGVLTCACAPALAGAVPGPLLDDVRGPQAAVPAASAGAAASDGGGLSLIRVAMHGGRHGGAGGWHGGGGGWRGGGGWHRGGWHHNWGGDWDGGWIGLGMPALPYYGYYAPYDGYYDEPVYVVPRYVAPARHYVTRMSSAHVRWCEARYRTYRPSDNSFQPSHGPRQQCIAPYG